MKMSSTIWISLRPIRKRIWKSSWEKQEVFRMRKKMTVRMTTSMILTLTAQRMRSRQLPLPQAARPQRQALPPVERLPLPPKKARPEAAQRPGILRQEAKTVPHREAGADPRVIRAARQGAAVVLHQEIRAALRAIRADHLPEAVHQGLPPGVPETAEAVHQGLPPAAPEAAEAVLPETADRLPEAVHQELPPAALEAVPPEAADHLPEAVPPAVQEAAVPPGAADRLPAAVLSMMQTDGFFREAGVYGESRL